MKLLFDLCLCLLHSSKASSKDHSSPKTCHCEPREPPSFTQVTSFSPKLSKISPFYHSVFCPLPSNKGPGELTSPEQTQTHITHIDPSSAEEKGESKKVGRDGIWHATDSKLPNHQTLVYFTHHRQNGLLSSVNSESSLPALPSLSLFSFFPEDRSVVP